MGGGGGAAGGAGGRGRGQAGGGSSPAVSFKCGKMSTTPVPNGNGKLTVSADTRRGVLSAERRDGALHLVWRDRQTQQLVDDFIVFPGDQTFARVDTGRADDRVYLLTFSSARDRRFFYWMQEPDASKDAERVAELNRLLSGAGRNPATGPTTTGAPAVGAAAAAAGAGAAAAAAEPPPLVGMDELESVLAGLGLPPSASAAPSSSEAAAAASADVPMAEAAPSSGGESSPSGGGGGGGVGSQDPSHDQQQQPPPAP